MDPLIPEQVALEALEEDDERQLHSATPSLAASLGGVRVSQVSAARHVLALTALSPSDMTPRWTNGPSPST